VAVKEQSKSRRSRRARRRESLEAGEAVGATRADEADDDQEAQDPDGERAEAADDSEELEEGGGLVGVREQKPAFNLVGGELRESAPADNRAERRRKRKRRAAEDDAEAGRDAIRDRNRRLREKTAANRRSRRDERETAAAQGLDASEVVDDALARLAHTSITWLRKNFNTVQWIVVLLVAGGISWQIYDYRAKRNREDATDVLMDAVEAERGRVPPAEGQDPGASPDDLRQQFPSEKSRLEAAEEAYAKLVEDGDDSATAIFARLGHAGVLFDEGKYDEALAEYNAVKTSALSEHDDDVQGRVLENIGLCLEGKKDLDAALGTFRELENKDIPGFTSVAKYHQARLLFAKGEKEKALGLIKQVREKLADKRKPGEPAGYLEISARELHRSIDPEAAEAPMPGMALDELAKVRDEMAALQKMLAKQKGRDVSEAELREMLKDPEAIQKMLSNLGKLPGKLSKAAPSSAPAPQPAPSGSP
jgi:predicted negative regulator of RcsB-dependent stress response